MHSAFATEKVLTNTFNLRSIFLDIFHPLTSFTILPLMTNIIFSYFSLFGLSFLGSFAVIVFSELQLLSNDYTIAMFYFAFIDISFSCFLRLDFVSLLQNRPEVYLFWLFLPSMAFVFCSCL